MNALELMEGFGKKLKDAQKRLTALEKTAADLAAQEQDYTQRVQSMQAEIEDHECSITGLAGEREDLQFEFARALFDADEDRQQRVSTRRNEIDDAIAEHNTQVEALRTEIDALDDVDQRAVIEAAIALDQIATPDVFTFTEELRRALYKSTADMRTRVQTARRQLPSFDSQLYEETRMEADEGYASRKRTDQLRLDRIDEAIAANTDTQPRFERVTDSNGYMTGWNELDSEGNVVGFRELVRSQ